MKNVSIQLLLLVSLLVLVFRHELVEGRYYCTPVLDPNCDKPCNPENPNCLQKQGAMDTKRVDVMNYYDKHCNPSKDPNCVKPCNPENPNC